MQLLILISTLYSSHANVQGFYSTSTNPFTIQASKEPGHSSRKHCSQAKAVWKSREQGKGGGLPMFQEPHSAHRAEVPTSALSLFKTMPFPLCVSSCLLNSNFCHCFNPPLSLPSHSQVAATAVVQRVFTFAPHPTITSLQI